MRLALWHAVLTTLGAGWIAQASAAPPRMPVPAVPYATHQVLAPLPEQDQWHAVGLSCPTDHASGMMETQWQSRAGQRQNLRVIYRAGRMQQLEILTAAPNQPYRSTFVLDLIQSPGAEVHESVRAMAPGADRLRREVCLGNPAVRAQHEAMLEANRAILRTSR